MRLGSSWPKNVNRDRVQAGAAGCRRAGLFLGVGEVVFGDRLFLWRGYAFCPSLNHLRIFAIRALTMGPLYA